MYSSVNLSILGKILTFGYLLGLFQIWGLSEPTTTQAVAN